MERRIVSCKDFPPNGRHQFPHDGYWEIHDDGESGHPSCWEGGNWRPIRLVVSRWKTSNIPLGGDWNVFSGNVNFNKGTRFFRTPCPPWAPHRPTIPKFLHQEEMNLHFCRGYEGEILMHDPVIESSAARRISELNRLLVDVHELPIIHIAMNLDDYTSNTRAIDVFIKDGKLDQVRFLREYDSTGTTFLARGCTLRSPFASSVGACEYCAEEGEVNMVIQDNHHEHAGAYFGRRGYGWPVPMAAFAGLSPTASFVFNMPTGGRLRIPKNIMDELMAYSRWRGVKVYPPI